MALSFGSVEASSGLFLRPLRYTISMNILSNIPTLDSNFCHVVWKFNPTLFLVSSSFHILSAKGWRSKRGRGNGCILIQRIINYHPLSTYHAGLRNLIVLNRIAMNKVLLDMNRVYAAGSGSDSEPAQKAQQFAASKGNWLWICFESFLEWIPNCDRLEHAALWDRLGSKIPTNYVGLSGRNLMYTYRV